MEKNVENGIKYIKKTEAFLFFVIWYAFVFFYQSSFFM